MRTPALSVLALLAVAAPRAQAATQGDNDSLWDSALSAAFVAELDRQSPANAATPISHNAILTPELSGGFYLHPLVDESEGALALIPFYQHPGEVKLTVGDANAFTDAIGSKWSSTTRTLMLDARVEGYPWHETGLFAEGGASFSGVTGDVHGDSQARYSVGLIHYFRPNLRGELGYVGSANQSTLVVSSLETPEIQEVEGATNAGEARFMAVLLNDLLSSNTEVQIGQLSNLVTASSAAGSPLPGEYTHGLSFFAEETVTAYIGHDLSGALTGGVEGSLSDTEPDQRSLGISSTTDIAPIVGASLQYFFIDPISLKLSYVLSAPRVRAVLAPEADLIDQVATLTLVGRL